MKWYRTWCPCPDEVGSSEVEGATRCAKGGGTLAKASSEAAARQRVRNHLVNSPYHNMTEEEADRWTAEATVLSDEEDEEEEEAAPAAKATAASARRDAPAAAAAASSAYPRDPRRDAPAAATAATSAYPRERQRAPGLSLTPAPSSMLPAVHVASSAAQMVPSGEVTLRAVEFQMVLDCVARCARSIRDAERVCDRAAAAFRAEAAALEACHASMTTTMAHRPQRPNPLRSPTRRRSRSRGDRRS